jgi:hypothetical protein
VNNFAPCKCTAQLGRLFEEKVMKQIPNHLISDKVYSVNLISYTDPNGYRRFVYLAVRQDKMVQFRDALTRGELETDDFGLILEEGKGEPSDLLKAKMEFLYGCDHAHPMDVLSDSSAVEA